MMNYNNIPSKTDWGEASNLVNDNFARTKNKIEQLESYSVTGLKYLGVVANYTDLPTTNMDDGNAYLVKAGIPVNPQDYPNGEIFVWVATHSPQWSPTGLSAMPNDILNTIHDMDNAKADKTAVDAADANLNNIKADKTVVATADTNLQTQINTMSENALQIEERYSFQMVARYNGDKQADLIDTLFLSNSGCVLAKNSDYSFGIGRPNVTSNKFCSFFSVKPNTICQVFANNVSKFIMSWMNFDSMILSDNSGIPISLEISNSPIRFLGLSNLLGLRVFSSHETNLTSINLNYNTKIESINTYNMPECTSVSISNASLLSVIGLTDSPKLSSFKFTGTFDNLVILNFYGSPLITLDTIMAIGNVWTSRVGKNAGFLRITTAIFDAMTQDQKNVFINKNINIEHQ